MDCGLEVYQFTGLTGRWSSAVRIQFAQADERQVVAFGLLEAKQPFEAAFDAVRAGKHAFFGVFELVRG